MKTIIIFRKDKEGEVMAVLPYEIADLSNNMTCYVHIGQHSAMSPVYYRETKPATPEEYRDLLEELINIGYEPEIKKRINWRRYSQECKQSKQQII